MAQKRYKQHSATYLAYISIAEKICTRGPNLDISIDQINKAESHILGNVFYDFRHFKAIKLYSDPISYSKIEGRTEMFQIDKLTLVKLSGEKLSQNMRDNQKTMGLLRYNLAMSENIEIFQLLGFRLSSEGWASISHGFEKSKSLKRVIINNCNLAEKDHMAQLTQGTMKSNKVEYVDLSLNNLNDKHAIFVSMIIKEQFERKE